ncbi:glycosyltransferase family 39 protein [Pontibacter sp. G13]|uniref:ArnT family glycosyltransferase n=1 Tax=Pontibacter sp. G13 TaxID=3074898 RepID=UPI00288C50AF|nr:glycosyltransferase family 39 protein [Pontibacter sp. G13]WNJ19776.1 glycosyltransferase family 39 protein [Pontibacter sp. G13]
MRKLLKFIPFLVLYILIIAIFGKEDLKGDEGRYIYYVTNLLQGFYSPTENPFLRNGPGYPLFLLPFYGIGFTVGMLKYMNAALMVGALYFFEATAKRLVSPKIAWLATVALGLYFPIYRWLVLLSPVALSIFQVVMVMYGVAKICESRKWDLRTIGWTGAMLGFLVLTKYIFGMAIMAASVLGAVAFVVWRKKKLFSLLSVMGIAFACCIPYLIYTYSLTGRTMYWGTNGGEQLYWMSSDMENEWGNWYGHTEVLERLEPKLSANHTAFYREVKTLSHMEMNDRFKEQAIANIKANPTNYIKNWLGNMSRLWFGFPNSHKQQSLKAYFYLIPNMFLVVFLLLSVIPLWKQWHRIPLYLWAWATFFAIYLGGTSIVTAIPRYLLIVMPFLILWLAYVADRLITLKIHPPE